MTGHVIWGDFTSALRRHEQSLLAGRREAFGDDCPGMVAIGGYIDGTLRAAEKVRVEEHLAQCPLCRRLAVDLYLLLKHRASPPPEEFMRFLDGLVPGQEATA